VDIVTNSIAVLLMTVSVSPTSSVAFDEVDLVEVNHFFDEQGKRVFDQIIFYDWSPVPARYQVRAWRLIKSPSQMPARDWRRGDYVTTWRDGDLQREVRAKSYRESWTQHDPELLEREHLPKEKRRELYKPLVLKLPPRRPAPPAQAAPNAPNSAVTQN